MTVLTRRVSQNRPKKTRIGTPTGWVNVTREILNGKVMEVVKVGSGNNGKIRALTTSFGFRVYEKPKDIIKSDLDPKNHQHNISDPANIPKSDIVQAHEEQDTTDSSKRNADVVKLLRLLGGKIPGITNALAVLKTSNSLSKDNVRQLIIAERAGKNRKGVLRLLGVDVGEH